MCVFSQYLTLDRNISVVSYLFFFLNYIFIFFICLDVYIYFLISKILLVFLVGIMKKDRN